MLLVLPGNRLLGFFLSVLLAAVTRDGKPAAEQREGVLLRTRL